MEDRRMDDRWMDRLMDVWINGICSTGILEESPDYVWVFAFFSLHRWKLGSTRKEQRRGRWLGGAQRGRGNALPSLSPLCAPRL